MLAKLAQKDGTKMRTACVCLIFSFGCPGFKRAYLFKHILCSLVQMCLCRKMLLLRAHQDAASILTAKTLHFISPTPPSVIVIRRLLIRRWLYWCGTLRYYRQVIFFLIYRISPAFTVTGACGSSA